MDALEQRNIQLIIFYKRNYPHKKTGWPFIKLFLFWILFCRPNGSMVHGNVEVCWVLCAGKCALLYRSRTISSDQRAAVALDTVCTLRQPGLNWAQRRHSGHHCGSGCVQVQAWGLCPGDWQNTLYILGGFYRLWATLSSNLRTPIKTSACSCVHSFHLDNCS